MSAECYGKSAMGERESYLCFCQVLFEKIEVSMNQDLFHLSVSPWELVLRTVAVYLVILFLLRIAGRKQIAQMGPTELVAMLLISNAVQNSMNAGDNTLIGGLISAVTLIFLSKGISYVTYHSQTMSNLIEGKPIILVVDGKVQKSELKKILMTLPQLRALLMLQGVENVSKLHRVVMDSEGRLLVVHDNPKSLLDKDGDISV
jgi:uncharacterized membrane protein YcaP (DUF421 family)